MHRESWPICNSCGKPLQLSFSNPQGEERWTCTFHHDHNPPIFFSISVPDDIEPDYEDKEPETE